MLNQQLALVEDEKRRHIEANAQDREKFRRDLESKDQIIDAREKLIKELACENQKLNLEIN